MKKQHKMLIKLILFNLTVFIIYHIFSFFIYDPTSLSLSRWDYEIYFLMVYTLLNLITLFFIEDLKYKLILLYSSYLFIYLSIVYFLIIAYEKFLIIAILLFLFLPIIIILLNLLILKVVKLWRKK